MKNCIQASTKKHAVLVTFLTCALLSSNVLAKHKTHHKYKNRSNYNQSSQFYDYAKVTSVKPIYKAIQRKVPVNKCYNEPVRYNHRSERSHTPVIVGGLIGGALGNKLGHKKSNKRVGAVIGTILGASIASDINRSKYKQKRRDNHQRHNEHCSTKYDYRYEDQLVGYNVRYYYHGHHYRIRTNEHPGKRLKMKVRYSPVMS